MLTNFYEPKPQKFRQNFVRWLYTVFIIFSYLRGLLGLKKTKSPLGVNTKAQLYTNLKVGGIHLHCTSINEINIVQGLVNEWLNAYPKNQVTLSTPSVECAQFALNVFNNKVQHAIVEYDLRTYLQPFINALKPQVSLLVGANIWPNLLQICYQNNIACALINASMHQSELSYAKRYAWLYRNTLRRFDAICTIDRESFENFLAFGMYKPQLHISRNIKFDILPDPKDEVLGEAFVSYFGFENDTFILGAGTSEAEEKQLLNVFLAMKKHHTTLRLVVVPLSRASYDDVCLKFRASGLETYQYSDYLNNEKTLDVSLRPSHVPDCIVVNSISMLNALSSSAFLSFIGSSDASLVGQSCMQGALNCKPMMINAAGFDSDMVCDYLHNLNALAVVNNSRELYEATEHWLTNKELAKFDGERGSKALLRNGGAIEITMNLIHRLIEKHK
ncbi:3-deoxy-D-manno-octulosonic acid transferase [Glaciecola sp. 2405UD65-10]|uniref:3-deoxy-D-manno-octulosonic acid transferase n=1 Tax=Glaciecola sp. 2405UD65-10 TaxID=3397244 RepID=UPI003B597BAE